MKSSLLTTLVAVLATLWGGASAFADSTVVEDGVSGHVLDRSKPVVAAKVYAYEVTSTRMREVATDKSGRFLFERLPAGMYKLVAFKSGFVPAIELLLRRQKGDAQFVEIRLEREDRSDTRQAEGYWTVRGRVPPDVLRQIQTAHTLEHFSEGMQLEAPAFFEAEMQALSGVEQIGGVDAQWTSAGFDVRGGVGGMAMSVDGHFKELSDTTGEIEGHARSMALEVEPIDDQKLRLATQKSELAGGGVPADLQSYQVDWAGKTGDRGQTRVSASYTEETNYHAPLSTLLALPGSSQTWGIEGGYRGQLTDRTSLDAGLSYRQREIADGVLGGALEIGSSLGGEPQERLGLYSVAGSQIQPRVLVEYGLYSSVLDGSLSLMPHGGVVIELGGDWKARTSVARRVADEGADALLEARTKGLTADQLPTAHRSFRSAFYSDRNSCREVGEACYEVTFTHGEGDRQFSLGAVHRELAETLRLYFSSDFFNRLESVVLIDGDTLPELQFSLVRRLAPRVLAKLESNIAEGGGGIFYATDATAYENQIRYLVTSLDTRFQKTSTGVFVAFHHLEQAFQPIEQDRDTPAGMEMQRLQLMLTQDLNVLADLASNWAVRLNMELSRGSTPYTLTDDGEMNKKLSGGLSVSF